MSTEKELHVTEGDSATATYVKPNKKNIFKERYELFEQKKGNAALVVGRVLDKPVFNHKKNAETFYEVSLRVNRDNSKKDSFDILDVIISDYIVEDIEALVGKTLVVSGELRSMYNICTTGDKGIRGNKKIDLVTEQKRAKNKNKARNQENTELQKELDMNGVQKDFETGMKMTDKYADKNRLCIHVFAESVEIVKDSFNHANYIKLNAVLSKDPVKRRTPSKKMDIADLFLKRNAGRGINYYFPSIAWRRNAIFSERLQRGDEVYIVGRLQSRQYVKKVTEQGERPDRRTVHEISIVSIELVSKVSRESDKEPDAVNKEEE